MDWERYEVNIDGDGGGNGDNGGSDGDDNDDDEDEGGYGNDEYGGGGNIVSDDDVSNCGTSHYWVFLCPYLSPPQPSFSPTPQLSLKHTREVFLSFRSVASILPLPLNWLHRGI
ncbi:hypothetical protein PoB_000646800 [Plakobranchus ocellatus]|uniref:Uncharacterized protein n=1 Tax=Plakobranchus ocellatus TaxID=259542 RepID=A0AAV3YC06_9GAST|nr:hypothetical protein PoB_000646800 [Plakobranchus ocellatus]